MKDIISGLWHLWSALAWMVEAVWSLAWDMPWWMLIGIIGIGLIVAQVLHLGRREKQIPSRPARTGHGQ